MKYLRLSVLFFLVSLFGCAHGNILKQSNQKDNQKIEIARRGCCSWHNGVCGCDTSSGRAICCDGTLSPSCGCD